MFVFTNGVFKSTVLMKNGVRHAFSTREGGVSTLDHTKTMSLSFGLGDSDDTVMENMKRFFDLAELDFKGLCGSPQFHSNLVRTVAEENRGEGITRENIFPTDAFVTDRKGVCFIVRMADCTPLLFVGEKADGSPVVGAAHAGWRGTVGGIGENTVNAMVALGTVKDSIKVAIGQCIHSCCFEVKEDFFKSVSEIKGEAFARRHISEENGKMRADIVSMNVEILKAAGIDENNIDISPHCTVCNSDTFHSHRATGGKRGTMGAVIGIL